DSVPLVIITGQVPSSLIGSDAFQECDMIGISRPVVKHSFMIKDPQEIPETIKKAFYIASTGRPGPVVIDIPKDVTAATTLYEKYKPAKIIRSSEYIKEVDIQNAISMIREAKRPYILVGGGAVISDAADELKEFAEKVDAPVCDTLMGKGAFNGTDERYSGMLGMHGTKASNLGVSHCDLLIAVGTRFSDRVLGNPKTFAKNAKILQIDVDPVEINKNICVSASIIGDVKAVLTVINRRLEAQEHKEWLDTVKEYKEKYPLTYDKGRLTCPEIMEAIYDITKGEAVITTEVGQHQMWAAQFYKYDKPRKFLTSGGLGTMGYGLGASLGAKVGNPDKIVVNIAGDGCFRMNLNELATASRYNIPVIEVIINNSVLGMVRQWQDLFYEERYSYTTLQDKVDFVKVAEGLGVQAKKITDIEQFKDAFKEALNAGEPVVLDCHIDLDDKVWPMVNPGGSIEDAFDKSDLEAQAR
ncbi:biosynthetic-type acetolactate synthase large subunit, partial [Anaerostipes sp.]|uniref:biosynthetic-type acetolactate synthase large subunit n=1 Tax=Anaerostipes sp. TaxID=1872530 RepID=UPI00258BDD8E